MHKISIIIPVYNVEEYLPQCLDSVLSQTYQNLEIILVNDGSTDSCAQICDEYALRDHRIKVIHQENGGLSDARNAGLEIATGAFISFVDGDDLLSLDFCQILVQNLIENKADIVECGFCKFKEVSTLEKTAAITHEEAQIFETEVALKLLMTENLKQVVWNKIYRQKVVAALLFPVNKINEDEYWTYKVFGNSTRIVKIQDELYFYRQQDESIMGRRYSLKRLDGLQALEERILYMKQHFPTLHNLAIKAFCFGSFAHYQKISDHPEIDPQCFFRENIKKNVRPYNTFSVYKNWKLKTIFWFQLFMLAPRIYVTCRKFNDRRVAYLIQKHY